MNQVVRGLWITGSVNGWPEGFDLIVNLESGPGAYHQDRPEGAAFVWAPMHDDDIRQHPDMPNAIRLVAGIVNLAVVSGKRVLIHCTEGLNRSGLVVARALIGQGFTAEKAVATIRKARGEYALCNASFVEWLKTEEKQA